jgi:hypothetical protein
MLLPGPPALAGDGSPTKADLQTACLYHFTKFVDWPPSAFPSADVDFVVGVLGRDAFSQPALPDLEKTIEGQMVNGHHIHIRRIENFKDAARQGCHILFIASSETKRLEEIIRLVSSDSILTVSEIEGFAQRGGMIQFTTNPENKVRFEINPSAARRANLRMSSQLLNLATKLRGDKS